MTQKTQGILATAAAGVVLFTALVDPMISVGLVLFVLLSIAARKLVFTRSSRHPRRAPAPGVPAHPEPPIEPAPADRAPAEELVSAVERVMRAREQAPAPKPSLRSRLRTRIARAPRFGRSLLHRATLGRWPTSRVATT